MRDTLHTGSSVAVVSSNRTLPFRVFAALLAGMIALAANIALLSIAIAAGIRTAHGGLFLLFTRIIHRAAPSRSFMDGWKIFCTARLSGRIPCRHGSGDGNFLCLGT
jgi:hypothetical protein